jgi:hypothetical protein
VIHTFPDGDTIEELRDPKDLRIENRILFGGQACLEESHWPYWIKTGAHRLLSLRDKNGLPKATLLLGDMRFVATMRQFPIYRTYCGENAFADTRPRVLNRKLYFMLQCCPRGYASGDAECERHETQKVQNWWQKLPTAAEVL